MSCTSPRSPSNLFFFTSKDFLPFWFWAETEREWHSITKKIRGLNDFPRPPHLQMRVVAISFQSEPLYAPHLPPYWRPQMYKLFRHFNNKGMVRQP